MKGYSNVTLVLACIAYMILPAIPDVPAPGNPPAEQKTKTMIAPAPPSKEREQDVIKASRSLQAIPSNRLEVVETSKKYIGTPYVSGGDSPAGFDCSGFVQYVFQKHGFLLPRSSSEMYKLGIKVTELKPGDLVFFNTGGNGVSHVGIYIGNNKFISATNKGVKIDHLHSPYWGPKFIGAKRV